MKSRLHNSSQKVLSEKDFSLKAISVKTFLVKANLINSYPTKSGLIDSKSVVWVSFCSVFCISLSMLPTSGFAQEKTSDLTLKSAQRLSTVIGSENATALPQNLPNPNTASQNTTNQVVSLQGMMWNTPSEIAAQQKQKDHLLRYLSSLQKSSSKELNSSSQANNPSSLSSVKTSAIDTLSGLIQSLPVTGRVLLPATDPRWLETHPQLDPIISSQDSLKNPERKNTVTLIQGDGRVCVIPFKRSVYAKHYAKLCANTNSISDWAWVIQADGVIQKVSLSTWNAGTQNYPAAGSWIWVPKSPKGIDQITQQLPWNTYGSEKGYFSEAFSEEFAVFLATQGPSDQVALSEFLKADRTFVEDIVFDLKLDQSEKYQPKDSALIASDWGSIGLLQTPTSRMMPAGSALFSYSHITPYSHYNFVLQPLPWLETSFRYSSDTNNAYGSYELSGNQSYVDKSIDLKIRLLQETATFPDVAVGLRDLTGTGLFSGEYVVANKRFGDFDFSAGLAWGYLGNRGNVKNPFSLFGSSFSSRPTADVGSGGNFSFGTYFHGQTALFGGVQYQTSIPNLSLKLELDGNNYQTEPFSTTLEQRSPINFGAVYRWNNANLTVGVERGNTAMISISVFDNLSKLSVPKLMEAPAIPISYKSISPPTNERINVPSIDPWQPSANSANDGLVMNSLANQRLIKVDQSKIDQNAANLNQPSEISALQNNGKEVRSLSTLSSTLIKTEESPSILTNGSNVTLVNKKLDIVKTSNDIREQSGWHLVRIEQKNKRWMVTLDEVTGVHLKERINRVIAVLHRDAPQDVTQFVIQYQQRQLPLIKQSYNRQAWMMKNISLLGPTKTVLAEGLVSEYPSETLLSSSAGSSFVNSTLGTSNLVNPTSTTQAVVAPSSTNSTSIADTNTGDDYLINGPKAQRLTGGFDVGYQQTIGGPNGYLFALSALGTAELLLWDGAWIKGITSLRVLDNYDKFTYDAPSNLPRVRTYMREYLTSNRLTIPTLQATQVAKVGDSHYFSAYGGMLEMMYGGVGGEWLYRPLNSSLAVGVDVNQVRQRDFDQRFNFLDYQVTTGHITAYWQTGWEDVLAKLSYGQYLAGDRGYTVDVSKAFSNGVKMGAYFTRTNVSAEQFGEGSFDKGIYVSIPFDAFFTKYSNDTATILWNPLVRDGGAKLNRMYQLYNMTGMRDERILRFGLER
ncbi:YjbH domain-containing protein [Polynucleobacter rarus]|uniref:YjbH domain-containing protein n=1 Tax=Polynucleobacter rarus TaxID=556055 RepID=UPI000D3ECD8A|nr:YjbH domain-containing protein [Polynucleobacter rarus]